MRHFTIYVTDSLGNKLFSPDLEKIFNLSNSSISKILSSNDIDTLKELVYVRSLCKGSGASNKIYLRDGYALNAMAGMFNRSQTWALNAYNKFGCNTVKDFQTRDNLAREAYNKEKPGMDVDSIPTGTWEKDNYKCPPATGASSEEVDEGIAREEAGNITTGNITTGNI